MSKIIPALTFPGPYGNLTITQDAEGNQLFDGVVYGVLVANDGTPYGVRAVGISPELAQEAIDA